MVGDLFQQSYHKSTTSDEYYPVDGTKSETDNCPDDSQGLSRVKSSGLQNQSLSRGGIREILCCLFKAGVTREVRDWLQPAQYPSTANLLLEGQAREPVHHNLSLL